MYQNLDFTMPVPNKNRSPSPLPHPRNSELNSSTRRSFTGNPFHKPSVIANPRSFNSSTPANSPLAFGRRLSAGSCDSSDHEKENDQCIKPFKSRSVSNGSKHFMTPTISAAYKQSPSPRKKVLVDRNEPVRTSISLSDGKASFFSSNHNANLSKSESFIHQNHTEPIADHSQENEVILERPLVSKVWKKVTFAESTLDVGGFKASDSVVSDSDCVVTDYSSAKNESFCDSSMSPPVIAPLDADPIFPPYDPKTNYLSPRPQFLHYKPNERIEALLNKEKELVDEIVNMFEDNLLPLENWSDTADAYPRDAEVSSTGEIESQKGLDDARVNLFEERLISLEKTSATAADEPQRDNEDSSTDEIESHKEKEDNVNGFESLNCVGSHDVEDCEKVMNVKEIIHGFESLPGGSLENSEKVINVKGKEKKSSITRWRLSFLLMVVLLVSFYSFSDTYSPAIDSTMFKALNVSQLHTPGAVIDQAKANLYGFTERFKQFSDESVSYLLLLISSIGQRDQLSPPLQFMNLTELQNNVFVRSYHKIEESPENLKSDIADEETDEGDDDDDDIVQELNDEAGEQSEVETETNEWDDDIVDELNVGAAEQSEVETLGDSISDHSNENEAERDADLIPTVELPSPAATPIGFDSETISNEGPDDMLLEHYGAISTEIQEVHTEHSDEKIDSIANLGADAIEKPSAGYTDLQIASDVSTISSPEKFEDSANLDSDPVVEVPLSEDICPKTQSDEIQHPFSELHSATKPSTKTSTFYVMGATTLLILAVVSIAFAVLHKRGNSTEPNVGVRTDHLLSKKTVFPTSSAAMMEQQRDDGKLCSHNSHAEEDYDVGESCPTEMSSFQSDTKSFKSAIDDEAESREKRQRKYAKRESFSSSLSTSISSYGSYTTFERMQIKNATRDEVVTPVRRSSRIRSHVTS